MTIAEKAQANRPPPATSTPAGSPTTLAGDLNLVAGSLHDTFDELVGAAAVDSEIQQVASRFTNARIRSFVPLFVQRYAGAGLRARSSQAVRVVDDSGRGREGQPQRG